MTDTREQQINREACAWIARLHGAEPSQHDIEELRNWMDRSSAHKAELRRLARRWDELNVLTELAVPVGAPKFQGNRNAVSYLVPARGFAWLGAVAATIVVMFAASLFLQSSTRDPIPTPLAFSTDIGERRLITLVDGSTALLNTNSQLRVEYSSGFRNIHLLQGEAHFEVAKSPKRPFRVFAGSGMVRAVGTAFSVYRKEAGIEVTVTKGSIAINSIESGRELDVNSAHIGKVLAEIEAGHSVIFDESIQSFKPVDESELAQKLSWQEGTLQFSGESLEHVIEEVSRYTKLSIVILDPELRDLRIGGRFEAGKTEKILEALESGFGVQVNRIDGDIVELSLKRSRKVI